MLPKLLESALDNRWRGEPAARGAVECICCLVRARGGEQFNDGARGRRAAQPVDGRHVECDDRTCRCDDADGGAPTVCPRHEELQRAFIEAVETEKMRSGATADESVLAQVEQSGHEAPSVREGHSGKVQRRTAARDQPSAGHASGECRSREPSRACLLA